MDSYLEQINSFAKRVVDNLIADSHSSSYSKEYTEISKTELTALINHVSKLIISKIESATSSREAEILQIGMALGLFLIGDNLQKKIDALEFEKNDKFGSYTDPLSGTFFYNCIDDIFGEPYDVFADDEEIKSAKGKYLQTNQSKVYDAFMKFAEITPFKFTHTSPLEEQQYYDFDSYVEFWKKNDKLSNIVKKYHCKKVISNNTRWWLGQHHDYFGLNDRAEEYRTKEHPFLKEIFTLEHAYIYNIQKSRGPIEPKDIQNLLENYFEDSIKLVMNEFFSANASVTADVAIKNLLMARTENKAMHDKRTREREAVEKKKRVSDVQKKEDSGQNTKAIMIIKQFTVVIIALSLIALLPLPYSYYVFLKIAILIFTITSVLNINLLKHYGSESQKYLMVGLIVIGLIYNPIVPVHLNKYLWKFLNVVCAGFYYMYLKRLKAVYV